MNSPKKLKNLARKLSIGIVTAAQVAVLLVLLASLSNAQQIEKLELVLSSPTINTDRGDGYQYEMRGTVYQKADFKCGLIETGEKAGRYLLRVRYNQQGELIATFAITLNDRRTIAWESYSKHELGDDSLPLSFAYEGRVLSSGVEVLADFTPQSPDCFGGKLVLYFLNGG